MTGTMDFQAMFTAKQAKYSTKCNGGCKSAARLTGSLLQPVVASGNRSTVQAGQASERNERLARLRREIAAGRYFVSSSDVAESLMRSMLKK